MSGADNASLEACKARMQDLYGENRKITDGNTNMAIRHSAAGGNTYMSATS